MGAEEKLLAELRETAEPLLANCEPSVCQAIEVAVEESIAAWQETCHALHGLCHRYTEAARLWREYSQVKQQIQAWAQAEVDPTSMEPLQVESLLSIFLLFMYSLLPYLDFEICTLYFLSILQNNINYTIQLFIIFNLYFFSFS